MSGVIEGTVVIETAPVVEVREAETGALMLRARLNPRQVANDDAEPVQITDSDGDTIMWTSATGLAMLGHALVDLAERIAGEVDARE